MRKYLKFIVLFLIAVFILWFFGRNLDWQVVRSSLARANGWYLSLAVAIICVGYLLRAIRWQVLLSPITPSSLKELFATTTVGYAAVFFVGRAAEIVRPMWLPMRDKRVRPSAALVTLGMERIFDFGSLLTFFAINMLFFTPQPGREKEFEFVEIVGVMMLIAVAAGFMFLYFYQGISPRLIGWIERVGPRLRVPSRILRIFVSILKQLRAAAGILRNWKQAGLASFWTLTLWFAIAFPTWLVLLAFDLPFSFSDSLFIMGIAAFSSLIPTPGGAAGAFHTGTAASLLFLNSDINREDAAAVSIAMHLVYFAPAIVFGLYYFVHGDISVERFRSLLSSEHAVEEIESESPDTK